MSNTAGAMSFGVTVKMTSTATIATIRCDAITGVNL